MASHDILTFAARNVRPIEHKRKPIPQPDFHFPGYASQHQRMDGKMRALQSPYQTITADIHQSELGLDPDYVLVFEVAGGVASFAKSIERIDGFKFISDEEWDCWDGEENFFMTLEGKQFPLPQRLYAVLSSQRAVQHLMALWERYCRGEKFGRKDAAIYHVFEQLHDVHYWSIADRVDETYILQNLQYRLENGETNIPLEVELWYLKDNVKADAAIAKLQSYLEDNGGSIVSKCRYDEIKYQALAIQVPPQIAIRILNSEDCEILSDQSVRLLKPLGQTVCAFDPEMESAEGPVRQQRALAYDKPICALLDGLPVANHSLLQGRLMIDDPDNYAAMYPAVSRVHGTGMASLIIYGDLNAHAEPITRPLYVRPIMQPNRYGETVPDGVLFPDILHRVIKNIRDNHDLDDICIVNLSVCDFTKPFMRTCSAEARMIDWLSEKYHVLFIVSAGNRVRHISLEGTHTKLMSLSQHERDKKVFASQVDYQQDMRLLAPAETINNLTIGSLNNDLSQNWSASRYDLISNDLPALYSPIGFGANRSIKPDAMLDGGRMLYHSMGTDATYQPVERQSLGPGQQVVSPASLNTTTYTLGTSNSAAIASHICHDLYEVIRSIPNSQLGREDMSLAIKAMFIHSCAWNGLYQRMLEVLPYHARKMRNYAARFIGYGVPDVDRVRWSTDERVVVLGHGAILQDQECDFIMPLPPSLIAKSVQKRLTITLAWNTPISVSSDPRIVKMYFEPTNTGKIGSRSDSDQNMSRRGTVQHEVFEGASAAIFEDGDAIKITIGRKRDAIPDAVKFVVMASLEVAEASGVHIYEEVKARLNVGVPVAL